MKHDNPGVSSGLNGTVLWTSHSAPTHLINYTCSLDDQPIILAEVSMTIQVFLLVLWNCFVDQSLSSHTSYQLHVFPGWSANHTGRGQHDNPGVSSGLMELFCGPVTQLPHILSTTRVPWMISQSYWQRSAPLTLQRTTRQIKRAIFGQIWSIILKPERVLPVTHTMAQDPKSGTGHKFLVLSPVKSIDCHIT
jgi:hypothetical protein